MFSLELDRAKKLEVGLVGLILLVAGYFVLRNWTFWSGQSVDTTITSWIEEHDRPANDTQPAGADNPYDPKKRELTTVFANHDGRLQLIEYPADPDRGATIRYLADFRGTSMDPRRAQWARLADIHDDIRRVLAMEVYRSPERAPSILDRAGLSKAQRITESTAREAMQTAIATIDGGMRGGSFEHGTYEKVLAALNAYRKNDRDLAADDSKRRLAIRVMDAGLEYVNGADKARREAILKYADTVEAVLNSEQLAFLAEQAGIFAQGGEMSNGSL